MLSAMVDLKTEIGKIIKGDIDDSDDTRSLYSHDASLFELKPQMIISPSNVQDIQNIVKFVSEHKKHNPELYITARSAGTDMSGGAIGESLMVDFTKHFNKLEHVSDSEAHVQPGVYYRNFEPSTLRHNALMPSFPASRELCTVGGMVSNNSGGEMSLRYGKTINFVKELKMVLSDGNEYVLKPLNRTELNHKMAQNNFEGQLYKRVFNLVDGHYEKIKAAKPHVSKNSTGYNLWDIWDRETGVFDLTKAIVGSQGTLGLITDIKFKLVPKEPYSGVLVCFMKNMDNLGDIINVVMTQHPTSFESFDNYTLNLSIKFFPYFRYNLGWWGLIKLGWQLIPDALILMRGIPKLIMLIEFTGASQTEVTEKLDVMKILLRKFKLEATEEDETPAKAWKFRIMRRESFNLLRKKVKDKHTAPYIDDLVVPPQYLPEFLPKLRKIINKYKLTATVAGHMGDGNFHIIPLMKIEEPRERAKLEPSMREVNELVLKYGGSLSGEHNDGLIRGPWLGQMYGREVVGYFKELKHIFDPDNMFNPHIKATADWDFSMAHIREHF